MQGVVLCFIAFFLPNLFFRFLAVSSLKLLSIFEIKKNVLFKINTKYLSALGHMNKNADKVAHVNGAK